MRSKSRGGISAEGQRGYHILRRVGLDGLICFGPRLDKQEIYVHLDEWLGSGQSMAEDEALATLAARYFASHGPATLTDFAWWSGLAIAKARTGLALIESSLAREVIGGADYWRPGVAEGLVGGLRLAETVYYLGMTSTTLVTRTES